MVEYKFHPQADRRQDEDGKYMLPEDEVATIKNELVGLMISVPPSIQAQLGEAISVIADSDFWERWATLVDVRSKRLKLTDGRRTDARTITGFDLQTHTKQRNNQQRRATSRAFHLQEVEATFPIRSAFHRDQSRSVQIQHTILDASPSMMVSFAETARAKTCPEHRCRHRCKSREQRGFTRTHLYTEPLL